MLFLIINELTINLMCCNLIYKHLIKLNFITNYAVVPKDLKMTWICILSSTFLTLVVHEAVSDAPYLCPCHLLEALDKHVSNGYNITRLYLNTFIKCLHTFVTNLQKNYKHSYNDLQIWASYKVLPLFHCFRWSF